MCDACDHREVVLDLTSKKRRRLWEMTDGWHCSIIGTCLTLGDLRALGRKLKLKVKPGFPADYQFHGYFVKEASSEGRAAKMLNKLLDKRHAVAIKRARAMVETADLHAYWEASLEAGDIPGPYWALLSHPLINAEFCERMFADVHMLSHLVGASNRTDIRRLQQLEDETDALRQQLKEQSSKMQVRLAAKDAELQDAKNTVRTAAPTPVFAATESNDAHQEVMSELLYLKEAEQQAREAYEAQAAEVGRLQTQIAALKTENDFLERQIDGDHASGCGPCPFNLGGCKLLYVGGRHASVKRLRALVREWNGELIHHDGGLEQSPKELASAVARADAVLFPTDCVSHDAMWRVKKLCTRSMKPFVPLRTSGVGSMIAGMQRDLGEIAFQHAAE